jgi:hypothetical protein
MAEASFTITYDGPAVESGRMRCEQAVTRRARHLEAGIADAADLVVQDAAVECCQPHTPEPPACRHHRKSEDQRSMVAREQRDSGKHCCRDREREPGLSSRERDGEAQAESTEKQMRRGHARGGFHRSTSFFSSARRVGPMPGTESSSSTDENAPCSSR